MFSDSDLICSFPLQSLCVDRWPMRRLVAFVRIWLLLLHFLNMWSSVYLFMTCSLWSWNNEFWLWLIEIRDMRLWKWRSVGWDLLFEMFEGTGLWASPVHGISHVQWAGTARISPRSAVLGPKARHEARWGTAREARRVVPGRHPAGRAGPSRGGPLANYYPVVSYKITYFIATLSYAN
jgi:hypothetical protein